MERAGEGRGGALTGSGRGPVRPRPGVLLTVEDHDGHQGQGEASPLPGWSRESAAACERALAELAWPALELPADDADPRPAIGALVAGLPVELPAARFALETALFDLLGRRRATPSYRLLSGRPAGAAVPRSSLLLADDEAEVVAAARRALAGGARTLKWKVGRPGALSAELATLRAMRQAVGPAVALRLDANGAFQPGEAAARVVDLAEAAGGIELIEEPVAGGLWRLPAPLPVPVAADESLAGADGPAEVERAIASGRCQVVVLKPTLLGGALRCLRLAQRFATAGATALCTHAFEGPVGLAAVAALALALPPPVPAVGLDRHPGLEAWPELELPMLGPGWVLPTLAPGLGLPPLRLGP